MILHLSRMCRNVNRKNYNDRKNVSATTYPGNAELFNHVTRRSKCGQVMLMHGEWRRRQTANVADSEIQEVGVQVLVYNIGSR